MHRNRPSVEIPRIGPATTLSGYSWLRLPSGYRWDRDTEKGAIDRSGGKYQRYSSQVPIRHRNAL